MRRSEVGDEWTEDKGVDAFADCDHRCDAAEECRRPELGMDQRRRQDAEERNRKQPACRREYSRSVHPLEETRRGDLRDRDEEGVEDEKDYDCTGADGCMRLHK